MDNQKKAFLEQFEFFDGELKNFDSGGKA